MTQLLRTIALVITAFTACTVMVAQENKPSFLQWLVTDEKLEDALRPLHGHQMMTEAFPTKVIDTTIDVQSYDVTLDWYRALKTRRAQRGDRKATGIVKTVVRARVDSLSSVVFDATTLIIDSVTVNGAKIVFRKNVRSLTMDLPSRLRRGQDVELTIYYANTSDDRALYLFAPEDALAINVPYASGFTFSQPEDARRWFPCNDQPDDKAYFTAHVRVPRGFTAVSNGVPTDSLVDGDSASTLCDVGSDQYAYFAHSYFCPINEFTVRSTTQGCTFTSVIEHGNVFGVQFHPEKSGALGVALVQKFVNL